MASQESGVTPPESPALVIRCASILHTKHESSLGNKAPDPNNSATRAYSLTKLPSLFRCSQDPYPDILVHTGVIQRAHHVLHNFLAVRFAGALLSHSAPPMHDHDAIRDRKNVRQRMADEDDRHLLFA